MLHCSCFGVERTVSNRWDLYPTQPYDGTQVMMLSCFSFRLKQAALPAFGALLQKEREPVTGRAGNFGNRSGAHATVREINRSRTGSFPTEIEAEQRRLGQIFARVFHRQLISKKVGADLRKKTCSGPERGGSINNTPAHSV